MGMVFHLPGFPEWMNGGYRLVDIKELSTATPEGEGSQPLSRSSALAVVVLFAEQLTSKSFHEVDKGYKVMFIG